MYRTLASWVNRQLRAFVHYCINCSHPMVLKPVQEYQSYHFVFLSTNWFLHCALVVALSCQILGQMVKENQGQLVQLELTINMMYVAWMLWAKKPCLINIRPTWLTKLDSDAEKCCQIESEWPILVNEQQRGYTRHHCCLFVCYVVFGIISHIFNSTQPS